MVTTLGVFRSTSKEVGSKSDGLMEIFKFMTLSNFYAGEGSSKEPRNANESMRSVLSTDLKNELSIC